MYSRSRRREPVGVSTVDLHPIGQRALLLGLVYLFSLVDFALGPVICLLSRYDSFLSFSVMMNVVGVRTCIYRSTCYKISESYKNMNNYKHHNTITYMYEVDKLRFFINNRFLGNY